MREDYYELLDMPPTATKQELRAAYRRLAMRFHPDHSGDDPAAEERFKLIAEAWRTLGDAEKRADYDAWLELHKRYERLPELASMPRHVRVSSRHGEQRRSERGAGGSRREQASRRVRPFLLRRVPRVGWLRYVLMCMCALLAMQPFIRMYSRSPVAERHPAAAASSGLAPGESPLPPEERIRQLGLYVQRLRVAAEQGDSQAQYRYGCILNKGIDGVVTADEQAALYWWNLAAAQGNRFAVFMLNEYARQRH